MYAPYTLQEYYDKLEKDFHQLFLDFQDNPAGKTIHQLRINIKKQMAFFQVLRALEPHLPLEEIHAPFAAFYKNIGKIRNLEIRQVLVAKEELKQHIKRGYATDLADNIQREKALWSNEDMNISLVPFRIVSEKVRTSIDRLPLYNIKENLGEYFYFLIEEIRQIILSETPSVEQLHDLRKFLKVLLYNLKLTDRLITQSTLPRELYHGLKTMNELLGVWHDQFVTIYKLSAKTNKIDRRVLNFLRRKERATRKRILRKLSDINDWLDEIKKELFRLFTKDQPVKIPLRKFREKKYQSIRNSFSQINSLELTK